jgi:hypothetical protein
MQNMSTKNMNLTFILMCAVGGAIITAFPGSKLASALACGLFLLPGAFLALWLNIVGTKGVGCVVMVGPVAGFIYGATHVMQPGAGFAGLVGIVVGVVGGAIMGTLTVLLALLLGKILRVRS